MSCMCGDFCCPSCGPAQGNWRCPICNEWASEGCIHVDQNEDTGEVSIRPEFKAQADAIMEADVDLDQLEPDDIIQDRNVYKEKL